MEEAAEKQRMNIRLLEEITEKGFQFTDCIYCDALLDQYYVLRASSRFFLAEDGSYSGAVEQIVQELGTDENRKSMRKKLQNFLSCRTDQGQRREAGASISVQERGQYLSRTNDSTVCK